MSTSYDKMVKYIKNNTIEKIYDDYQQRYAEFSGGGWSSYVRCHIQYLLKRCDFKRIIWNMFIKSLWVKPYSIPFNEELLPAFYEEDGILPTFYNAIKSLKQNINILENINFDDKKSYEVLGTIIYYRISGDKRILFNHIDRLDKIYFDNDIKSYFRQDWDQCIIDCGAYIGDTLTELIKRQKVQGKIYCFEANQDNFNKLKRITSNKQNIICKNVAVGSSNKEKYIIMNGQGSHFADSGEIVKSVRLDDFINEPITFIKMDIEGAEMEALQGCELHLKREKPTLAISVYHKLEDIFKIYSYLDRLNLGYKFVLRKYGNTISELVLYAF